MFSNVLQKYNKFTKYQNERVIFSPKTFFFLQKHRFYAFSFPYSIIFSTFAPIN